jgi:Glycosyl hydrolases family 16
LGDSNQQGDREMSKRRLIVALIALALAPATQAATIRAVANNNFVSATATGTSFLTATAPAAGSWEEFQVINNSDGTVSFRATISGNFVAADVGLGAPNTNRLIANRTAASTWERFWLEPQSNGTVAIRAVANNLYVAADLNIGGALIANRTAVQAWEQFTITNNGGGGGGGRTLVWSDEFDSINTANWTHEVGGGGWGNNELEYYTPGQNVFVQFDAAAGSNVAVLEARRGNPGNLNCWYGSCQYTSARMKTEGKRTFRWGRIEARLKLPQTQGIWPAFWMLGSNIAQVNWPTCGELDIMEHVGFEPTLTHGAMHGPGYSGNTPIAGTHFLNENANANYHVYAIEWDTNGVRWFVDNTQFYSVTRSQVQSFGNWVFDQPFFILLNVAVGGNWPGSPDGSSVFPQRMYVDYVRVYQ